MFGVTQNAAGEFKTRGLFETNALSRPPPPRPDVPIDGPFLYEQGEEQFRKAMWGFDGEEEASSTRAATGSGGRGDPMDVDSGATGVSRRRNSLVV